MRFFFMKSFIGVFIGLVLNVGVGAEPLVEGRVRLDSGDPAVGVQVRLFDMTDLERGAIARATTDATGHFALSLQAFSRGSALPQGFALGQNYPNPFNPSTIIPYQLPIATHVRLEVFNLLGQRVATLVDEERPAGFHTAQWDATDAAGRAVGAGVYIYRLRGGGYAVSRRMVLIDGQAGMPAAVAGPVRAADERLGVADGTVYGMTVAGAGLVPYVNPAFRVGVDAADIVMEAQGSLARMKRAASGILGDVNNDGQVDASDALYVLLYIEDNSIVLPNNGDISLGDLNEDGTVDFADLELFVRYLADPSDPALPAGIGDDHGDALAEATVVALGDSTSGSLFAGDVDYFVIEVSSSSTLSVTTTGSTNTYGDLLDSSGNVLASNDDAGTDDNFRFAASVGAGTYYLRVRGVHSSTTGDYTLEVIGDDHANTLAEATAVALGSPTAGSLLPGDADYFRVEISDAGLLSATTTGSTDTKGDLLDSSGNVLASNDDAGTGRNFRVSVAVSAGTYYLRVRGVHSSITGDYTLEMTQIVDDHGDAFAEATAVALGSPTSGSLFAGDVDYFVIEVSSSSTLLVTTTGSTDTHGALLDSSGNVLASNDDAGRDDNFRFAASVSAGTYYLRVRGVPPSTAGDYTLEVIGDDHANTLAEATAVALGSPTSGSLFAGDADYFRVEISDAGLLSATTTGSTDTHGALLDSSGNVLASNDDAGTDRNFRVSVAVSAGTYYLRVKGVHSSTTGDYTLEMTQIVDDHGDAFAEATAVALGSPTAGSLFAGDADYFRVEISDAGLLSATTTGSTDTKGDLLDSSGNVLASNDDAGTGRNFRVSVAVSAGTYYLRVRGVHSSITGDYTLEMTQIVDDHGDVLAEATAVALGSSTAGSLFAGDVDYFVIEVSSSRTLLVATTGSTDTYGDLLDSSGSVLASNDDVGTDRNFRVSVAVSAGTYYLRVKGVPPWTAGDYTLEVRDNSPDLVVESPLVSESTLSVGDRFRLEATVRNQGTSGSTSTTLRYYRSDDATIDATDTKVGTDNVSSLDASGTSAESIALTAPTSAGTYYYGACVENVAGESNTDNNCSSVVTVTVEQKDEGDDPG